MQQLEEFLYAKSKHLPTSSKSKKMQKLLKSPSTSSSNNNNNSSNDLTASPEMSTMSTTTNSDAGNASVTAPTENNRSSVDGGESKEGAMVVNDVVGFEGQAKLMSLFRSNNNNPSSTEADTPAK